MSQYLSRLLLSLIFGLCMAPAHAITSQEDAFNRIKLLEGQILLGEQIGTEVCLMLADIDDDAQSARARDAVNRFADIQAALRAGDKAMGLLPESSAEVLKSLDQIDDVFETFRAATLQLAHDDLHTVPMSQLMRLDFVMRYVVQNALLLVEAEYGETVSVQNQRATQSAARRQSFIAQRIAKDLCYITIDISPEDKLRELHAAVASFEFTQAMLWQGNVIVNILPPQNLDTVQGLEAVDVLWKQLSTILKPATESGHYSEDLLIKVLRQSDTLLSETQKLSQSYQW